MDVNPPGPVHEYVLLAAPSQLFTLTVRVGFAQVIGPLLLQVAAGGVTSAVRVVEQVAVQPLSVLVTVTVYVPATLTTGHCEVDVNPPGPVHEYVLFAAPSHAFTLIVLVVLVQVSGPLLLHTAGGGVISEVRVVEQVAVQPFVVLVTVTV